MDYNPLAPEVQDNPYLDYTGLIPVHPYMCLELQHSLMVHDLPAGMPRLMQTAQGYVATVVSGEVVQENGKTTRARPGQVVRGGQCAAQRQAAA